ncbi:hypothetical protein [Parasulfitobacter algicola]|uniref:Uncharacterized protein n=1 Tax=Parasulfitobacter algicola TaxID=2614809 RepID=A0ABX2IZB3_9RHOB|nr:hypothetical protein [Sulfitobacter algicola]NSX56061.1 hypothetical protein [Sulfitobacter algicola]
MIRFPLGVANKVVEQGLCHAQPTLETGISDVHGFVRSIEAVINATPFFDIEETYVRDMAKDVANVIVRT